MKHIKHTVKKTVILFFFIFLNLLPELEILLIDNDLLIRYDLLNTPAL